jgi:hypothetical protein
VTNIIKFPTAAPAVSDDQQKCIDKIVLCAKAILIGKEGELHQYVPKQPRWCRTIGDDISATISEDEPVSPTDIQRLSYVFDAARANERAAVVERKPRAGQALLVDWVPFPDGPARLTMQVVSLCDADNMPVAGSA